MKTLLRVALVVTSKRKAREVLAGHRSDNSLSDDDEPPDLLAEFDSDDTIAAVSQALASRYAVTCFEADERLFDRLRRLRPDLVFNISEGFSGPNRESHVPIVCEMLGLAYTGSDALTLSVCLDKACAKKILAFHGLATPSFFCVDPGAIVRIPPDFRLPAIVKPLREGSSMGIRDDSLVHDSRRLRQYVRYIHHAYRQPALVEEFLSGREFSVGLLGNPPRRQLLPVVEINHAALPAGANPIYGYEAKWVWDDPARPLPVLLCPAQITAALRKRINGLVLQAADLLAVRDWCRVDVRLDADGKPHVLELNPLPGILPDPRENSTLPAAARAAGKGYQDLILEVAAAALQRVPYENCNTADSRSVQRLRRPPRQTA